MILDDISQEGLSEGLLKKVYMLSERYLILIPCDQSLDIAKTVLSFFLELALSYG